jgi:hypothetical protein
MNEWELHLIPYPTLPVDRPLLFRLKELFLGVEFPSLAVILPSAWPDLAEKKLRFRELILHPYFQSWLYGHAPSVFFSQVERFWERVRIYQPSTFIFSIGERGKSPDLSAFLVELLWTLKVRRLQWLRENPAVLDEIGLTTFDLEELDELLETEVLYSRGRLERGEKDGSSLILFSPIHKIFSDP